MGINTMQYNLTSNPSICAQLVIFRMATQWRCCAKFVLEGVAVVGLCTHWVYSLLGNYTSQQRMCCYMFPNGFGVKMYIISPT